jgi:uracil-DNA glycosylase
MWNSIVGEGWAQRLSPVLNSEGMNNLMNFVVSEYQSSLIYPKQENVFRAFRLCPPEKLKVIILGQDPYHDGSATGLAFANRHDVAQFSPSLHSIWREVERQYGGMILDFDPTLEEWAHQGVLLLNTALTVKKYSPTSHSEKWHPFTKEVLKLINEQFNGLHFCFWGSHAKSFSNLISDNRHFKYYAAHPAAHVYRKDNSSWSCNHFEEINKKLTEQNGEDEIIEWQNYNLK